MKFVIRNFSSSFLSRSVSALKVMWKFYSMWSRVPYEETFVSGLCNVSVLIFQGEFLEWSPESGNRCHTQTPTRSITDKLCAVYSHHCLSGQLFVEILLLKRNKYKRRTRCKKRMWETDRQTDKWCGCKGTQTKKENMLNTSTWKE